MSIEWDIHIKAATCIWYECPIVIDKLLTNTMELVYSGHLDFPVTSGQPRTGSTCVYTVILTNMNTLTVTE